MKKEIICLLGLVLGLYLFLAIVFFSPADYSAFSSYGHQQGRVVGNITTFLGYHLRSLFGWMSLIIPSMVLFWVYNLYFYEEEFSGFKIKLLSSFMLLLSSCSAGALLSPANETLTFSLSGVTGFYVSDFIKRYFGYSGAVLFSLSFLLLSAILATGLPILSYIVLLIKKTAAILRSLSRAVFKRKIPVIDRTRTFKKTAPKPMEVSRQIKTEKRTEEPKVIKRPQPAAAESGKARPEKKHVVLRPKEITRGGFTLPPINLLDAAPLQKGKETEENLQAKAELLEETLRDFGIEAKVVNIEKGPVITRFELQPAPGVKVQWIASLSEDIGLVMKSYNVHVAPVPGKGTIGVEVPNITSTMVCLRDIIESAEFHSHKSFLALALGKKVSGESLVSDLTDMPHLLIAGTTGSGKTVCINSLIISLLYRATPEELRLILIDPKMVELMPFNGLPHLIVPVVTNANKAVSALDWAVEEMDSRYRLLSKATARNIEAYNAREEKDPEMPAKLPYIVIVIDELADLMLVASKEIEGCIARLAQLSRAVGIHMILATQRPSVDVITGVIKANFPSRISFKVASKVDSRTVLDMNGADKLVGKGDMLFIPPGMSKPYRAQGSLVSDKEIERVVSFIKDQKEPEYDESILESNTESSGIEAHGKRDKLYKEAVDVVMQTNQASVSMLQRRMGVGYTRAARLIDMMEEDNIVGPYQGSKPREILIDRDEYFSNSKPDDQ